MKVPGLMMEIGKHKIPVTVDSSGTFWAEWEGDSFRSETFKGLRVKLLPKVRDDAKRCEIVVTLVSYSDDAEDVTLVGIHGSNGNVLYLDKEGKTQQLGRRATTVHRHFTKRDRETLRRHNALVKMAEKRRRDWLKSMRVEPGNLVRKAIGLPPEDNSRFTREWDDDE